MAVKPILFNTEMVRAILDGRKRQTRRLVKNIPLHEPFFDVVDEIPCACDEDGDWYPAVEFSPIQVGDVLYVRETWAKVPGTPPYIYKATFGAGERKWRLSIHMPKEAARLFLRVTGVRCERLQDITVDEIRAEGLDVLRKTMNTSFRMWRELWESTVDKDDLTRYGWAANPWVWVIEFERCEKP